MKIAVTTWNERISPVFDASRCCSVYEFEGRELCRKDVLIFSAADAERRAAALLGRGVNVLICGAISREMMEVLVVRGIEVHSFVAGCPDAAVCAWREGRLGELSFAMPGCRCRRRCGRRQKTAESLPAVSE